VDRNDVRVLEQGDRLGFRPKTFQRPTIREPAEKDHLDGDDPVEALLAGPIHDSHAAPVDFGEKFVIRKAGRASPFDRRNIDTKWGRWTDTSVRRSLLPLDQLRR